MSDETDLQRDIEMGEPNDSDTDSYTEVFEFCRDEPPSK
jgi:hypothetical protein